MPNNIQAIITANAPADSSLTKAQYIGLALFNELLTQQLQTQYGLEVNEQERKNRCRFYCGVY